MSAKKYFYKHILVKRIRLITNLHYIVDMDSLHVDSNILGHYAYKNVWTPFVGEVLLMEQEDHNSEDCFAITILKSGAMFLVRYRELFGTSLSMMELYPVKLLDLENKELDW